MLSRREEIDRMDISFVIPVWNAKDLLRDCLQSIMDQKSRYQIQVLVVDNGSSDGAPEMVEQLFPDVRVIRNGINRGYAAACNRGITQSQSRYVCIINSDIVLLSGCVDSMGAFLDDHPDIGMACAQLLWPNREILDNCKKFPTVWNTICSSFGLAKLWPKSAIFRGRAMLDFSFDVIAKVEVIAGSFWMVRRDAIEDVGLLDEGFFFYGEDLDWCKRFWLKNWDLVFFPGAQAIHHHAGSSSRMPVRLYLQQQKSSMLYWKKHHGTIGFAFITSLILFSQAIRAIAYWPLYLAYAVTGRRNNPYEFLATRSLYCLRWLLPMAVSLNGKQATLSRNKDRIASQ